MILIRLPLPLSVERDGAVVAAAPLAADLPRRLGVGVEHAPELPGGRAERAEGGGRRARGDGERATAVAMQGERDGEPTHVRPGAYMPGPAQTAAREASAHHACGVERRVTREPTGRRRRCAWCSSVSMIARSAWASARGEASGASASGRPRAATMKRVRVLVERERAGLAGAADDAAGRAGEADEVLALAAGGAAGELRREAGREQQLQAEGERVRAAGAGGIAVEQRELVGQQVVDAGVRVAVVEDARDRLARARGAVQRAGVLAQARVRGDGLGRGDGQQVAAALVQDEVEPEERLEPPAEARARLAHALGDRAQAAARRGIQMEDAVRFAVAERAQDDSFGLYRSGYRTILSEVMSQITVYTTEPCGYCRVAKALLDQAGRRL